MNFIGERRSGLRADQSSEVDCRLMAENTVTSAWIGTGGTGELRTEVWST